MRRSLLCAALFGIAISPNSAHAAFQSGNELLRLCESKMPIEKTFCLGYIQASFDMWTHMRLEHDLAQCNTKNVSGRQIEDIILQFIESNTASRQFSAASLSGAALDTAFCKGKP